MSLLPKFPEWRGSFCWVLMRVEHSLHTPTWSCPHWSLTQITGQGGAFAGLQLGNFQTLKLPCLDRHSNSLAIRNLCICPLSCLSGQLMHNVCFTLWWAWEPLSEGWWRRWRELGPECCKKALGGCAKTEAWIPWSADSYVYLTSQTRCWGDPGKLETVPAREDLAVPQRRQTHKQVSESCNKTINLLCVLWTDRWG